MDHGTCRNLGVAGFRTSALVIMMVMIQEGVGPRVQAKICTRGCMLHPQKIVTIETKGCPTRKVGLLGLMAFVRYSAF